MHTVDIKKIAKCNGYCTIFGIVVGSIMCLYFFLGVALLSMDFALNRPFNFDRAFSPLLSWVNAFLVFGLFIQRWIVGKSAAPTEWVQAAVDFSWSPEAKDLLRKRLKRGICMDKATLIAVSRLHFATDQQAMKDFVDANVALQERYGEPDECSANQAPGARAFIYDTAAP